MKRALLSGLLFVALLAPASASAHPLGNFSINHLVAVSVSSDRVDLRYVLDQAEIPTFQERELARAAVLERKQAEVRRGLHLIVDGEEVGLAQGAAALSSPPGQGGLPLTRLELPLRAAVRAPQPRGGARRHLPRPRRLEGDRRPARHGDRGALERALR